MGDSNYYGSLLCHCSEMATTIPCSVRGSSLCGGHGIAARDKNRVA